MDSGQNSVEPCFKVDLVGEVVYVDLDYNGQLESQPEPTCHFGGEV